jgi:CheY-like chemotaxis protein
MIMQVVQGLGHEFIEASTGEKAIETIKEQGHEIALILLDWTIPDPDGYEVLKWVKAHRDFARIPVIMVSAMAHREKVEKALSTGARAHIAKPFDPNILAKEIEKALNASPEQGPEKK